MRRRAERQTPPCRQLVGLALAATLIGAAQATAGQLYRWVDEDGSVHYGDRMPARGTRGDHAVLDKGGTVVREQRSARVQGGDPSGTPGERQEDSAEPSQRQHDRMLLETFTTEADLLRTRERRLDAIERRLSTVRRQIERLTQQRDRYPTQLQSRPNDTPEAAEDTQQTAPLRSQSHQTEARLEKREQLRRQLRAERQRIAAEFDANLARFRELKAARE